MRGTWLTGDKGINMQELFATLLKELGENGPGSPSVQSVLSEIAHRFPGEAPRARAMVDGTLLASGGQPQAAPAQDGQSPWWASKLSIAGLSVLGGGSAGAGLTNVSWQNLQKPPLPDVTSQWTLLAIVAALGAVVGLAHSFYRNGWAFIMPVLARGDGRFQVNSLGFLHNVIAGAAVAVATTWIAFSNTAVGNDAKKSATEAAVGAVPGSLLTWNVLMSAVVAGVVGSRMSSGQVEKNTLWQALSRVVEAPMSPGLAKDVLDAKTPFDAVTVATGTPPPGFVPRTGTASQTAETEKELLALFDRPALKDRLTKLGKPVDTDAAGLTLGVLGSFQDLNSTLQNVLGEIPIAAVATISFDDFTKEVASRGLNEGRITKLLTGLHAQAIRVMELLRTLAATQATWSLAADRL
jgi:hypothetical protein